MKIQRLEQLLESFIKEISKYCSFFLDVTNKHKHIHVHKVMPNDCYNVIHSISHEDPEIIQRLVHVLSQKKPSFFAEFLPCPEHKTPTSYWGTKWDVYEVDVTEISETVLGISFYTAWTPPTEAYIQLEKVGFSIDAMFMESGFDFCGSWRQGEKTIFENVKDNLDSVPECFHFYFQEDEEDEEDDDKVGEL